MTTTDERFLAVTLPGDPVGMGRPRVRVAQVKALRPGVFAKKPPWICPGCRGYGVWPQVYNPPASEAWKSTAATLMLAEWSGPPLDGAVVFGMVAVHRRPQRLLRKKDHAGRMWRIGKPDLDNVAKAAMDAAVKAGVMHDDTQVVRLLAASVYAAKGEPEALHVGVGALAAAADVVVTMDQQLPALDCVAATP